MVTVNAMGDKCPIPVVKTKKAIQALTGPDTIEVLVDNKTAMQNVTKMASSQGGEVEWEKLSGEKYRIIIRMKGVPASEKAAENEDVSGTEAAGQESSVPCCGGGAGSTIVVVSSDRMGSGNDELGRVLLKGFIFAVTQLDELPSKMLFYNGGGKITCEGSDSLEDLKSLEAQGVEIQTCGTCLDYYQLKDKLAVGTVTNMYSIVEAMAGAARILRP